MSFFRKPPPRAADLDAQPVTRDAEASRLILDGNALEDAGDFAAASGCYDAAVALAPDNARTHLNRGNVLLATGDLAGAHAAYTSALARDPGYSAAHFNLGNACLRAGSTAAAADAYRNALAWNPQFVAAEVALGNAQAQMGEFLQAVESFRRALVLAPHDAHAHCHLGHAQRSLHQFENAIASYRHAIEIDLSCAEAFDGLGCALRGLGRLDEALENHRRALALAPRFAEAHHNCAQTQLDAGLVEDAIASYRVALEINPRSGQACDGLAMALRRLGRLEDAKVFCLHALAIDPEDAQARMHLGIVQLELGQVTEAIETQQLVLRSRPDFAEAHSNLGNAFRQLGQGERALVSFIRAAELKPDAVEGHFNVATELQESGRLADAAQSFRRVLSIRPTLAEAHTGLLFCLSHDGSIAPATLYAEHLEFGQRHQEPLRARWPLHRNGHEHDRVLRIGIVSADLRNHPVAFFFEPLLNHLATSAGLTLHAYYNHRVEDATTERMRQRFSQWRSVALLSDEKLAQTIRDDDIDILIDLSGHTAGNRLLTFARKPAPVQVSWMGYPGTTGLTAMDYYLADRYFLPMAEFNDQFTEKLVHLPASAPFSPATDSPTVNPLPALRNGYVTFGSFNRLSKLSPRVIALWSQVLRNIPDARMLLGAMPQGGTSDVLMRWFAQEGIGRERLELHARCDARTYLALHHRVDMCLDTFPYSGGTTTANGLWMGVPTLTLAGHTPAGRHGATILGHLGLESFVAKDAEDFQAKGLESTRDREGLARMRMGLRERFKQSTPAQPKIIADGLERALRIMWQRWCADEAPAPIDVTTSS